MQWERIMFLTGSVCFPNRCRECYGTLPTKCRSAAFSCVNDVSDVYIIQEDPLPTSKRTHYKIILHQNSVCFFLLKSNVQMILSTIIHRQFEQHVLIDLQPNYVTNSISGGRDNAVSIAVRTGWTVRGSNIDGHTRFSLLHTRPEGSWCPPSLLYNGYWGSFPGVKWPGHGVNHVPNLALKFRLDRAIPLLTPCLHWHATGRA